jgi:hypothetical protein
MSIKTVIRVVSIDVVASRTTDVVHLGLGLNRGGLPGVKTQVKISKVEGFSAAISCLKKPFQLWTGCLYLCSHCNTTPML